MDRFPEFLSHSPRHPGDRGRVIHSGEDGDAFSSSIVALVDEFENRKRRAASARPAERSPQGSRPPRRQPATSRARTAVGISIPSGRPSRDRGSLSSLSGATIVVADGTPASGRWSSCAPTQARSHRYDGFVPACVRFWESSATPSTAAVTCTERTADESRGPDRRGHTRIRVTKAHERLVIPDHHPAYITQEQADRSGQS